MHGQLQTSLLNRKLYIYTTKVQVLYYKSSNTHDMRLQRADRSAVYPSCHPRLHLWCLECSVSPMVPSFIQRACYDCVAFVDREQFSVTLALHSLWSLLVRSGGCSVSLSISHFSFSFLISCFFISHSWFYQYPVELPIIASTFPGKQWLLTMAITMAFCQCFIISSTMWLLELHLVYLRFPFLISHFLFPISSFPVPGFIITPRRARAKAAILWCTCSWDFTRVAVYLVVQIDLSRWTVVRCGKLTLH